ncbi:DUF2515 family protein [Virgibacillus kekensis]|uniref:DUF2515 family protein n=1 Tax=Virgibacillus kekensis TaxID=202261 RepID=A0ABV9DF68_9BACI
MESERDIKYISRQVSSHNLDNISRTRAYQNFFLEFPEIKWAFVASMVSRNAGWNMTDLFLSPFRKLLSHKERKQLFMTYERANWLIFSDAYPQLLIYKLSKELNKPMFHLLPAFHVSRFMVKEWFIFWEDQDEHRLMTALIINEQNVIHQPVIKQSYFKYQIFLRFPYLLQDRLFMNAVLIPAFQDKLYGIYIHGFTNLTRRITVGKQIASVLFNPLVYEGVKQFAVETEHTGSRRDYERLLYRHFEKGPLLRTVYPVINHQDNIRKDWCRKGGIHHKWWAQDDCKPDAEVANSFYKRRKILYTYYHLREWLK